MVSWRPYSTEDLRHLAAHHRISGCQSACHSFQSSMTRIPTDNGVRIEGYGGTLARHLDQLQEFRTVHFGDPFLGLVVPGEMHQLSGPSTRLKGLHDRLETLSPLWVMHTWIVLQIIGVIDQTYIHKSSWGCTWEALLSLV